MSYDLSDVVDRIYMDIWVPDLLLLFHTVDLFRLCMVRGEALPAGWLSACER